MQNMLCCGAFRWCGLRVWLLLLLLFGFPSTQASQCGRRDGDAEHQRRAQSMKEAMHKRQDQEHTKKKGQLRKGGTLEVTGALALALSTNDAGSLPLTGRSAPSLQVAEKEPELRKKGK